MNKKTELDKARGCAAHFAEALSACEKASGFAEGDISLSQHIANIVKERDEALAKCAEMREALRRIGIGWKYPFEHLNAPINHALSTDCGKGWVRKEEGKP